MVSLEAQTFSLWWGCASSVCWNDWTLPTGFSWHCCHLAINLAVIVDSLFHWSTYLSSYWYHDCCSCVVSLELTSAVFVFCSSRFFFSYSGSRAFSHRIRISLLTFGKKKKVGWDFNRDCLEFLYWGVIAILTVLSLLLHEYNFFLFKCLISFNNILESSVHMFCTSFNILPNHLNLFDINESKML